MMGQFTEVASAIVAIAQVIFSSITIYRTRGDQIEKYGYAAYGLSVYPYALMSLANLIQWAVCGRYPFLYVLRTATLVEAEKKGGVFEGAVGNLEIYREESDAAFSEPPSWVSPFPAFRPPGDYRNYKRIVPIIGSLIFVIAVISHPVFVLLVSGFNPGQSTRAQRVWMLGWLIVNELSGVVGLVVMGNSQTLEIKAIRSHLRNKSYPLQTLAFLGVWVVAVLVDSVYVFAIGGFVTVGKMLRAESYQLCNI